MSGKPAKFAKSASETLAESRARAPDDDGFKMIGDATGDDTLLDQTEAAWQVLADGESRRYVHRTPGNTCQGTFQDIIHYELVDPATGESTHQFHYVIDLTAPCTCVHAGKKDMPFEAKPGQRVYLGVNDQLKELAELICEPTLQEIRVKYVEKVLTSKKRNVWSMAKGFRDTGKEKGALAAKLVKPDDDKLLALAKGERAVPKRLTAPKAPVEPEIVDAEFVDEGAVPRQIAAGAEQSREALDAPSAA